MNALRTRLSEARQRVPRGVTDSAHLFALLLDAIESSGSLASATDELVRTVREVAERAGRGATLNLLLDNGEEALAVRYATRKKQPPSLYWRETATGVVVASERTDDAEGWREVTPCQRLIFRDGSLSEQQQLAS